MRVYSSASDELPINIGVGKFDVADNIAGVMLLLSCWYNPRELSKRVAFFYTASLVSGAVGGLMAGGIISGLDGVAGTAGWKW